MMRALPIVFLVALLVACDRNTDVEPASGNPSESRSAASGPEMPPDHPSPSQELPQGHPPVGDTAGGGPPGEPGEPEAGGIAWEPPDAFEPQAPSSRMRDAQYVFSDGEEGQEATLVVYYFGQGQGGSVQDNVDRWVGQFETPDGEEAETEERTVDDLTVTVVDVTGTYQPMQMPGQASQDAKPGHRMLAAIVEGPNGPVFFKFVGPEPSIAEAESAFDALIDSIEG